MAKRSAQGQGTIRKKNVNGKEYYEGRITIGHDPATGKQIQKSFSGKTQSEVRKKMTAAAAEVDEGIYKEPSKMTIGEWLDTWCAEYLGGLNANTANRYKDAVDTRFKPAFGSVQLDKLNPPVLQRFINDMAKDLSPTSVQWLYVVLHGALKKAVEIGFLASNPADACELPRRIKPDLKPLDDMETKLFLTAAKGNRYEMLFEIALFTGMRRGELLGLQWDDVDFEKGTIYVHQQLQRVKGEKSPQLVPPKNKRPRAVSVAPYVMSILQKQRIHQMEMRMAAGPLWNDSGFVFTNELGKTISETLVDKDFKAIASSIGRADLRFHDLRHSYAVAGLRAGIDPKTISTNLGHSSVGFTLDVYAFVTKDMYRDAANKMEAYISSVANL